MDALQLGGFGVVHLDPGSYRWIDLRCFRIVDDLPDRDLLAAMMATTAYRHDYASPFDPAYPGTEPPVHGRWLLDRLAPTMFQPVDAATVATAIEHWVRDPDLDPPQTEASMARVRSEVLGRLAYGVVHELRPPTAPEAVHAHGWVVGAGGFLEYVVIDRQARTLTLIVASDD